MMQYYRHVKNTLLEAIARLPTPMRLAIIQACNGHVKMEHFYPTFRKKSFDSVIVPFDVTHQPDGPRVAIIVHAFHLDVIEDIKCRIKFFESDTTLIFTTDNDKKKNIILESGIINIIKKVEVIVCPNRGRDIAPKILALSHISNRFDLVLFLHSKKSTYFTVGEEWRNALFNSLAGSRDIVRSIMYMFDMLPELGLVFPEHFNAIADRLEWGGNKTIAGMLAGKFGVTLSHCRSFNFPSGSMFWVRPAALQPLVDLALTSQDFPPEAGQLDGTLAHAIERLFLFAVERAGYIWTSVTLSQTNKRSDVRHRSGDQQLEKVRNGWKGRELLGPYAVETDTHYLSNQTHEDT